METRRFGRTGHMSKVAILGGFFVSAASQAETDAAMEQVIAAGINHIDIAPSYGHAEERLGPWMARERERFFLGCKTMERSEAGAAAELRASLERLQVEHFDLYQFHAVGTIEELDEITSPGGALGAVLAARDEGLVRYIGITGHGVGAPQLFLEALDRFDFDSVLFPINFIQYADPGYRVKADELLRVCRARDVGTMIIKAVTRGPWGEQPKTHNTWYQPFTEMEDIQKGVNFVLSQDVTGLCTAGDLQLLPPILKACENYTPLSLEEQEALIATAGAYEPLFV